MSFPARRRNRLSVAAQAPKASITAQCFGAVNAGQKGSFSGPNKASRPARHRFALASAIRPPQPTLSPAPLRLSIRYGLPRRLGGSVPMSMSRLKASRHQVKPMPEHVSTRCLALERARVTDPSALPLETVEPKVVIHSMIVASNFMARRRRRWRGPAEPLRLGEL